MALLGLEQLVGCSVPSWVFSAMVRLFLKGREGEGRKEASKWAPSDLRKHVYSW